MTLDDALARIAALEREGARLKEAIAGYDSSFALYDAAQRELHTAYADAHPDEPDTHMHDAGKVSRWAADRLSELEREVARLTGER